MPLATGLAVRLGNELVCQIVERYPAFKRWVKTRLA